MCKYPVGSVHSTPGFTSNSEDVPNEIIHLDIITITVRVAFHKHQQHQHHHHRRRQHRHHLRIVQC